MIRTKEVILLVIVVSGSQGSGYHLKRVVENRTVMLVVFKKTMLVFFKRSKGRFCKDI